MSKDYNIFLKNAYVKSAEFEAHFFDLGHSYA